MLYLPILVPKFWQEIWYQNMQKGGEVQGGRPLELTYLPLGKKLCKIGCGVVKEVGGREGGNLTNRRICIFVTPFWLGGLCQ